MMRSFLPLLLLASPLVAKSHAKMFQDPALEEMRIDLEDLKFALKATRVDLDLLDEQMKKPAAPGQSLEKRVASLEKTLEKALSDLRTLYSQLNILEQQTVAHEKRLEEVVKLKGTLTSISKAIAQPSTQTPSSSLYKVKAGDSLEKIARAHRTTVEALKKCNQLTSDRIVIGQELKVRDE